MQITKYQVKTDAQDFTVLSGTKMGWDKKSLEAMIKSVMHRKDPVEKWPDKEEILQAIDRKQEEMLNNGLLSEKGWFNPRTKSYSPIPSSKKNPYKKEAEKEEEAEPAEVEEKKEELVGIPEEHRKKGLGAFVKLVVKSSFDKVSKPVVKEWGDSKVAAVALNKVVEGQDLTKAESKAAKKIMSHVSIGVCATLVALGAYAFLGPLALVAGNAYLDYRQQVGANYDSDDSDDSSGDGGDGGKDKKDMTTEELLAEKEEENAEKEGASITIGENGKVKLADGTEIVMTQEQLDEDIKNLPLEQLKEKYGDSLVIPEKEEVKTVDDDGKALLTQEELDGLASLTEDQIKEKYPDGYKLAEEKTETTNEPPSEPEAGTETPKTGEAEPKETTEIETPTDSDTEAIEDKKMDSPAADEEEETPTEENPDEEEKKKKDEKKEESAEKETELDKGLKELINEFTQWVIHQDPKELKSKLEKKSVPKSEEK